MLNATLPITEDSPRRDISTVYGYLWQEELHENGRPKMSDSFTCFNGDYSVGSEREFIATLIEKSPDRYHSFRIMWDSCN
jgi:hypothetical protein